MYVRLNGHVVSSGPQTTRKRGSPVVERTTVVFIFLVLVFAVLGENDSGARQRAVSANPSTNPQDSASSDDPGARDAARYVVDPDEGIRGRLPFGATPQEAVKTFGTPERRKENTLNNKPALTYAYDKLGLHLRFVEGHLYRIVVSSSQFATPTGLTVGSTFAMVYRAYGKNQFVGNGVFPFEIRKRTEFTGRYYFTKQGRVLQFLAPWPHAGVEEKGSDDRVTLLVFAAAYAP